MVIVRTDTDLLQHAEQMLRTERTRMRIARTQKDIAQARTRVQLAEEFVNLIALHQQQAAAPAKDFKL